MGQLLPLRPDHPEHHPQRVSCSSLPPRPGTISPWSSKEPTSPTTAGLKQVKRLERGIAYYVQAKGELSVAQRSEIAALLHELA
ncbi:hypothetical protein [Aeromonas caviae]|uniref:hypothetical protein n=1 Tax=Aeromonas caviae TaxID=648 RepID=UPI000A755F47